MPKTVDSLNQEVFDFLRSHGYRVVSLDDNGKEVPVPTSADAFQFSFVKDGVDYGSVTITIDGLNHLVVYYNDAVAESPSTKGDDLSWTELLRQIKKFATKRQMSFSRSDQDNLQHDMAKRRQTKLDESYRAVSKTRSDSKVAPQVKLIYKHTRPLSEGEARFRNIAKIFVETSEGERLLLPTTRPTMARVFARHIAEGGVMSDVRGRHLTEMAEDLSQLSGYVRATAGKKLNESAQKLTVAAVNRLNVVKESIKHMASHGGYHRYFAENQVSLTEDLGQLDLEQVFAESANDSRITAAQPALSRLQREVGVIRKMSEASEFEQWADSILEDKTIYARATSDIEKLVALISPSAAPLIVGVDAANAKGELYDLLNIDSLNKELEHTAAHDPESDARETVVNWIENNKNDPEIHKIYSMLVSDAEKPEDKEEAEEAEEAEEQLSEPSSLPAEDEALEESALAAIKRLSGL